MSLGILVHGDNHFVVRGQEPDAAIAHALVRHWSFIQIGQTTPEHLTRWQISTKEFREDLEWAIVVCGGTGETSTAVAELLEELSARGVPVKQLGAQ